MASKQQWMHDELCELHSCSSSMLQHHLNHIAVTPFGQLVQHVSCVLNSQGNVHHVYMYAGAAAGIVKANDGDEAAAGDSDAADAVSGGQQP